MRERTPPFQGIYYFYTAAETGSFKLAAQKLFVTAAAVSQQIRQLEEWLGADLFIRQHRKIVLTHEGEVLYLQAKKGFVPLPAYERILKAGHAFNILDARKAISVTERQRYILRIRNLTKSVAEAYYASREALGFPMCKKDK